MLLGSTEYSCPIDLWGVGCIFFEMSAGRPLFPGSTVEDELHLIFKLLGTPTAKELEEVIRLEDLEALYPFPNYSPQTLVHYAPRLDPSGLALLSQVECIVAFFYVISNSGRKIGNYGDCREWHQTIFPCICNMLSKTNKVVPSRQIISPI